MRRRRLSAIDQLTTAGGNDEPESQVAAMYRALTNEPMEWPGALVEEGNLPFGTFGSLAFRKDALTVLMPITDAPFHNGRTLDDPTTLRYPYSFNTISPYPPANVDGLAEAVTAANAKVISIACDDGVRKGDPYDDMAFLSDATGSSVPPSSFGGYCDTQLGGLSLLTPDGPNDSCRLIFNIRKNGEGLNDRVVAGVKALAKSLVMDVRVMAISDEPSQQNNWVDSVDLFVDQVEVSLGGGEDPSDPTSPCIVLAATDVLDNYSGPKGVDPWADGVWDTVVGSKAETKICFNVRVVPNTTIPATDKIQVYHAVLQVRAKNGTSKVELDFGPPRDVLFLIPAKPQ